VRKLAAGTWQYSKKVSRIGDAAATPGERSHARNNGGYVLADFSLWRDANDAARFVGAFVRHGIASDSVNEYRSSSQLGVSFAQVLRIGRENTLAFGASLTDTSRAFRRSRAGEGLTTRSRETALELTYRIAATSWLILQPDVQYIFNPSADPDLEDAVVAGLRFEVVLESR
jgi:porin